MFLIEKEIKGWKHNLIKSGSFEEGQASEIESHLRDEIDTLIAKGFSNEEAFNRAKENVGNNFDLEREYSQINNRKNNFLDKKYRDKYYAVSLLFHYMKIGVRILRRNLSYSFINIFGLSLGIAAAIISFVVIGNEFSYDDYHKNSDNIYRLVYERHLPGNTIQSVVSPFPLGPALKNQFAEVDEYTRYTKAYGKLLLKYNDISINEDNGAYADPGYLKMFDHDFIEGSSETALDDLNSIILTETTANKYFGEKSALGKLMLMEGKFEFIVSGVIKDVPANSHLKFNFLMPFALQERWGADLTDWNNWGYAYSYIKLNPDYNTELFSAKIENIVQTHLPDNSDKVYMQPLKEIHLNDGYAYDGFADIGSYDLIYIILGITLIILFSAVINFINLTSARAVKRMNEVGLRKAIGASKKQIVLQLIGETFVMILASTLLAVAVIHYALPLINQMQGKSIEVDYLSTPVMLFLGMSAIMLSVIAGGYPALLISSFRTINALKNNSTMNSNKSVFRRTLVMVQFVLALFLLTSSFFINNQFDLLMNNELGYNSENIICAQLKAESRSRYESLKTSLANIGGIKSISSAADYSPVYQKTTAVIDWEGKDYNSNEYVYQGFVDFGYLETLNLQLLEGRDFDQNRISDETEAYIINEKAASLFGFKSAPGNPLSVEGVPGNIIGVVKDYQFMSLHFEIAPLILCVRPAWRNVVFIKISSENSPEVITDIEQSWASLFPDIPFEYTYYDEQLAGQYSQERRLRDLFSFFALLALTISITGVWGFFSYIAEQRSKEIAIRKVLGGSVIGIVKNMVQQYFYIVLISTVIASGASYFFMEYWLQNFANKIELELIVFVISAAIGISLLLAAVVSKALQKALANPVDSIKNE